MRVLQVSAELYPWVKTGGLGDVISALPPALAQEGVDVRLCLPGFPAFLDALPSRDAIRLVTPFAAERVRIGLATLPGSQLEAYLIDHPVFYDRPGGPYSPLGGGEWPDNHRRFALLGWVAAALGAGADPAWHPDVVHSHDWHAGLAPAYLTARAAPAASVFTVHNLAYSGSFPSGTFPELSLPDHFFRIDGVEFYGRVSLLKAGIAYADRVTTVSPTYAREIQTKPFGHGFDGLLRYRNEALSGILNGIDAEIWNPAIDPVLPRPYGIDDAEAGKLAAKAAIRRQFGLVEDSTAPLFGIVSRLTWQKGLDLPLGAISELISLGGQLVLLGTGDRDLERGFAAVAAAHPGHVGVRLGYDESLSHLVVAGADVLLVPSRFEPCGLTQLYALRYGTLPLVRRTGGLADTVVDANETNLGNGSATGFVFDEADAPSLTAALRKVVTLYAEPLRWRNMVRRAMTQNFGWSASARQYLSLYRELRSGVDVEPRDGESVKPLAAAD